MKNVRILMLCVSMATGCASNPNVVKYIDTDIQTKGQVDNKTIGINGSNEVIIQEEVAADAELQRLDFENSNLYDKTKSLVRNITICRTDLADTRLGGSGELPMERSFDVEPTIEKYKEEIGLDSTGNLKVVKKSYYIEKRNAEKRLNEKLTYLFKKISRQVDECQWELANACRKAGLPSDCYSANSMDELFAARDAGAAHD